MLEVLYTVATITVFVILAFVSFKGRGVKCINSVCPDCLKCRHEYKYYNESGEECKYDRESGEEDPSTAQCVECGQVIDIEE